MTSMMFPYSTLSLVLGYTLMRQRDILVVSTAPYFWQSLVRCVA